MHREKTKENKEQFYPKINVRINTETIFNEI